MALEVDVTSFVDFLKVLGSSAISDTNINNNSWDGSPRSLDCLPFKDCRRHLHSVLDCIEILVEHGLVNFALSNAESLIFRLLLPLYDTYSHLCFNEWKCRLLRYRIKRIINVLICLSLGRGPPDFDSDYGLKLENYYLEQSDADDHFSFRKIACIYKGENRISKTFLFG